MILDTSDTKKQMRSVSIVDVQVPIDIDLGTMETAISKKKEV